MKSTEYSGKLIKRNGEEYTEFKIGQKCKGRMEPLLIALGAELKDNNTRCKTYIVKGNRINLMMLS